LISTTPPPNPGTECSAASKSRTAVSTPDVVASTAWVPVQVRAIER
jgi:hypothetical protein